MDLFNWQPDAKTPQPDANPTLRQVRRPKQPDAPDAPGNPTQMSGIPDASRCGRRVVVPRARKASQPQASQKRDGKEIRAERDLLRSQLADWNETLEARLKALAPHQGAFNAAHEMAVEFAQEHGPPPYAGDLSAEFQALVHARQEYSRVAHPYRLAAAEAERVVKEIKRHIRICNEELEQLERRAA